MSGAKARPARADSAVADPSIATFLEYARRGRNDWWRYIAAPLLGAVFTVVVVVVLILALSFAHLIPADFAKETAHPSNTLVFFADTALSFGAVLISLLAAIAIVHRKSPLDLMGRWRWRVFATGGALWLAILVVGTVVDVAISPGGFHYSGAAATTTLAVFALCALPIQTFAEEVVFRGYITQGLLLATKRPAVAATIDRKSTRLNSSHRR